MSPTTPFEWAIQATATRENGLKVENNLDGTFIADFQHVPLAMQEELRQTLLRFLDAYPDEVQLEIVNLADLPHAHGHQDEPPTEKGDGGGFISA